MPNWVSNRLTLEGPVQDLEALVQRAAGLDDEGERAVFTFNGFAPKPKDVYRGTLGAEEEKAYPGTKNWYGWNCHFWGTKWDCNNAELEKYYTPILDQMAEAFAGKRNNAEVRGTVVYTFDTAWSAPHPVVEKIAKLYPTINVQHEWTDEDSGSDNHGRFSYEEGSRTDMVTFNGQAPTEALVRLAEELTGFNPYHPSCEGCGDKLSEKEIAEHLGVRYGTCDKCRCEAKK